MTDTTATTDATAASPPPRPPLSTGFFGWLRSLGITRRNGWVGGVAAGIAARMGVDPLIVRGIFVVAALLGFPALFVYAVCWMLLPDEHGVIHLENLFRGRVDPPTFAAGIVVLVGVVPIVPWLLQSLFWPVASVFPVIEWSGSVGSAMLSLALLGLIIGLIVAAVRGRRRRRRGDADASPTPSPSDADATSAAFVAPPAPAWTGAEMTAAQPDPPFAAASAADPADSVMVDTSTAASSDTDLTETPEFAQWREQHEAWLGQHEAWRQSQADADLAARERAQAETVAAVAERNRLYDEARARRKATKPRTSFAYVVGVIALAAIAAAVTALVLADHGAMSATAAALFVATIVCATGMVVAGILRRRSGFLTGAAIVALLAALSAGVPATFTGITHNTGSIFLGITGNAFVQTNSTQPRAFSQMFGFTNIWVYPHLDAGELGEIALEKHSGTTQIDVSYGMAIDLTADLHGGQLLVLETDTDGNTTVSPLSPGVAGDGTTRFSGRLSAVDERDITSVQPITITQEGDLQVYLQPDWSTEDEGSSE